MLANWAHLGPVTPDRTLAVWHGSVYESYILKESALHRRTPDTSSPNAMPFGTWSKGGMSTDIVPTALIVVLPITKNDGIVSLV